MRTLREIQAAAKRAYPIIASLEGKVKHGPWHLDWSEQSVIADVSRWFKDMKAKKDVSAYSSGRLALEQDMDEETGEGLGWFTLYVDVSDNDE